MADAVTTQTIQDGSKYTIIKLTNLSDGTGESAVNKVDVSGLDGAPTLVTIEEIWYSVWGMNVTLLWDATTDVWICEFQGQGHMNLKNVGGIPNTLASGYTGDILLTTTGHSSGDSYTLILKLRKN